MTSHTPRDREPDSAPLLDAHNGPVCCNHNCTCSRVRDDYDAPSSLASLMPRTLERDTQYASGSGRIHLTDDEFQFPRDPEEGPPTREGKSLGKVLVFPRYWAWARLVQVFLSFFTMVIFSAYVDGQKYETKAIQFIWIFSALLSMLYSIGLATVYFGRSSRKLLLATFAPLIFAADVGSLSMQIVTLAVFPRNLEQLMGCFYYPCGRGNMSFVRAMWIPTVSLSMILYFASSCIALYITIVQMHLGTYNSGLRDFFEAYKTRKAREQRIHDLVQRILDGSLDVVPVAPNNSTAGRHSAAPYQDPAPVGRGYVSAGAASVALVETRREAYYGPFEHSSHSPAHTCAPSVSGAPPTPREPSSSGPYSNHPSNQHSTSNAPWQLTAGPSNHPMAGPSTSSSAPSRHSKFVLTTEETQTHAQSCCRRCGDIEPSPPSYIHAAVAALPQVPLQSTPTTSDDGEEENADQSFENTGLLRPSKRYMLD